MNTKKVTIAQIKKAIECKNYESAMDSFISLIEDKKPKGYDPTANNPRAVFINHLQKYGHKKQEHFICIALNNKNEVIDSEVIFKGTLNECTVHPREIFHFAVVNSAASIIIAHNHPSQVCTPSTEDVTLTKRCVEAGKIMGIPVLDHIIFCKSSYESGSSYLSMKEEGYF